MSQFLESNNYSIREAFRLLSVKDPIAYAQVSQVSESLTLDNSADMTQQYQTDEQQAEEWAKAHGIKWEEMTDDERDRFNEVDRGGF